MNRFGERSRVSVLVLVGVSLLMVSGASAKAPKVKSSIPENGELSVDPNLKEIVITFDQDMSDGGHSVCGGGEQFPELEGRPFWRSKREFVMRVKLKPNHDYRFSINCPSARNFKSKKGQSAEPYPMSFATKGGTSDVPKEKHKESFEELKQLFGTVYSYRDVRAKGWEKWFDQYEEDLCNADTPEHFGRVAGKMLAEAEDIHISVKLGDKWFSSFSRAVPANMNFRKLDHWVPEFEKRSDVVYTGKYPEGVGYILITSWSGKNKEAFEPAYEALEEFENCEGLIIDVRPNSGGAEPLAQEFAGCFVDEPVVYAKHVTVLGASPAGHGTDGGFTSPYDRVLQPSKDRPEYRGRVAVLTGKHVMSSCEAFLLMMKQVPDCKLIGETSYGSSGNPRSYPLPNGITVNLPSWKAKTLDGKCFEKKGIKPDIKVKTREKDLQKSDKVLKRALKYVKSKKK